MRTLAFLLALTILSGSAVGAEPEYQGKSLDHWIERTQPRHSVAARQEAIMTLGQIGRAQNNVPPVEVSDRWIAESVMPTLTGLLKDQEPGVRAEAASALCWLSRRVTTGAFPALIGLLSDPDAEVRARAASALTWRGTSAEAAIPALTKAISRDFSPDVRQNAARALRTTGPKGVDALLRLLDAQGVEARLAVLEVLKLHYPTENPVHTPLVATPKLVGLLSDESPAIRTAAVLALAPMSDAPPEAISRLLKDEVVAVRRVAAAALLTDVGQRAKQVQPALLDFVENDLEYRRENPGLVARVGPETIPLLIELLDDKSPNVRGQAASAFGQFGPAGKAAVEPLKRLLADQELMPRRADNLRICHCAAGALNRILGDQDYRVGLPELTPDGK